MGARTPIAFRKPGAAVRAGSGTGRMGRAKRDRAQRSGASHQTRPLRLSSMTAPSIPVLDLAAYAADPASPAAQAFVGDLRRACHEVGFFYLEGHGVDAARGDGVHALARRFFALPEADRLSIENVKSAQFRGYTPLGHEYTNGRADLRDQIDIGRELPPP